MKDMDMEHAQDAHDGVALDNISKIFNMVYVVCALLIAFTIYVVTIDNRLSETVNRTTANTADIKAESKRLTDHREETIGILRSHTVALENLVKGQTRVENALEAIRNR